MAKRKTNTSNKGKKIFNKVSKAYNYRPKLSNTLLSYANAIDTPQKKPSNAGRPPQIYKHTSPFSGKPIPAEQYYQEMRKFKRLQARRVEDMREQKLREYSKRGVPPTKIQQYEEQLRQQEQLRRLQQLQQPTQQPSSTYPHNPQMQNGTVIPAGTRVWKFRRGTVGTEGGLFGRKQKVYGLPSSFWN